jgi:BirA family biotin operon repressor/biotin-[acetyl-CoA-carboxylase] ligase
VSDTGGLWLSAVVPALTPENGWSALPLAAGVATCEALSALGTPALRLRWPNDVMVRGRKLAGLLVDQFQPDRAVIGIGINVTNSPEGVDSELTGTTTRLADLLAPPLPPLLELATGLLHALRGKLAAMERGGFERIAAEVNSWWVPGVKVEVQTDEERWVGRFMGVDSSGRLQVVLPDGQIRPWAAHQVVRIRELDGDYL